MLARRTSLPPTLLAPPRVGAGWPERTVAREAVMIAGVLWQVGPSAPVEGSAIVGDAYVRIRAPDRPSFARVAAGLRRVDRQRTGRGAMRPWRAQRWAWLVILVAGTVACGRAGPAIGPDSLDQLAPGTPVYWLGERFAGVGGLPPLALNQVKLGGADPGYRFILHYQGDRGGPVVVSLQEWPRAAWDALPPGSRREHPCAAREELALPLGRATLFLGPEPWRGDAGTPGACPAGPRGYFVAHAYLGETVVLLDASPANTPDRQVLNPYSMREGIEALLRALQLRTP